MPFPTTMTCHLPEAVKASVVTLQEMRRMSYDYTESLTWWHARWFL